MMSKYAILFFLLLQLTIVGQSNTFNKRLSFSNSSFGSLDGTTFNTYEKDSGYIVFTSLYVDSINNGWSSYGIYQTDTNGVLTKKTFYGVWGRRHFGGIVGNFIKVSNNQYSSVYTVLLDSTNNNNFDLGIMFYNESIDSVWVNNIDLGMNEIGKTLVQSTDNGYVIVGTQSAFGVPDVEVGKILLVKTDSVGNYQWHRAYNSPTQAFGLGICLAHDGGYILSAAGLKPGRDSDTYIIKTDTAGNVEWTKNYGTINFDGGGGAIQQTADSNYILIGAIDTFNLQTISGQELFSSYVMKLDINGNILWRYITNYGNWYHQIDMAREVGQGKGYIAVGQVYEEQFNGENIVGLILRFDNDGNLIWERRYAFPANTPNSRNGFTSYSILRDIQPTTDNGFIAAGNMQYIDPDVWILKLDSMGCMGAYCGLTDVECYYLPYPNCDSLVGIDDPQTLKGGLRVYPNPASQEINIQIQNTKLKIKEVKVYDVAGRVVHSQLSAVHSSITKINVSGLEEGLYFIEVMLSNGSVERVKFIKQ